MLRNYYTTEKVLEFCKSYIDKHKYAPTVREIAKGVGIASISTVHTHMQRLFKDGRIATEHPGDARAFRICK